MNKIYISLFVFCLFLSPVYSQNSFRSPLDIPLKLSSNFGELRPDHFHGGIDIKTKGEIGQPVYSIQKGYISRVSVSPGGYGLAVYINHPNGFTSVCGHLSRFNSKLTEYVMNRQYENRSYAIDLFFRPNQFPVKKGQLIAYSGDTGASGGPHVHFELRKTLTQNPVDPLPFFYKKIVDNRAPVLRGMALYPVLGLGMVNGKNSPFRTILSMDRHGRFSHRAKKIYVWGKIGLGISAVDKMTGTSNIYGVKNIRFFCDNQQIMSICIAEFSFANSRMINSAVDYDYWYRHKMFYVKSYREMGNKLMIYKNGLNGGILTINQERVYHIKYVLEDFYGNCTVYNDSIYGKRQTIAPLSSSVMIWNRANLFHADKFNLDIPKGNLYTNILLCYKRKLNPMGLSDVFYTNNQFVPLNHEAIIRITLNRDSLLNKRQYGVVAVDGKKIEWLGGAYSKGGVILHSRVLGNTLLVDSDGCKPELRPIKRKKWMALKTIVLFAKDDKSGIESYKGTIDGHFALFVHDCKSDCYLYRLDACRLKKNMLHLLVFEVIDKCGNKSTYCSRFFY